MGRIRKFVEAVKQFIGEVLRVVGGVLGENGVVNLHFDIAVAANAFGLVYIYVPRGTKVFLVTGISQYSGTIDSVGNVIFNNIPKVISYGVMLRDLGAISYPDVVIDRPPQEWDSTGNNFYRAPVRAITTPPQPIIVGKFTVDQLANKQITFQVQGYPIHARFTYSFLDPKGHQPAFHGDPGTIKPVIQVPIPAGIQVSLHKELAPELSVSMLRGRTLTKTSTPFTTVWNTVLYEPLSLLPDFAPKLPVPVPVPLSIHVKMEMKNEALGLGPIKIHGLQFALELPDHAWELPIIEIRSQTENVNIGSSGTYGNSFGILGNPYHLDINENSIQMGTPPQLPGPFPNIPIKPLGHLAIFQLQAICDVHYWFRLLSANAGKEADLYPGFEMNLYMWHTPWGLLNTVSWPPGFVIGHPLFLEERHWSIHSVVAHEFAHQISYQLGLEFNGIVDSLTEYYHDLNKYTSEYVALLEGWGEFVEAVFGDDNLNRITQVFRQDLPTDPVTRNDLWDMPGDGLKIEGCVSRALFQAYLAVHRIKLNALPQLTATTTIIAGPPGFGSSNAVAFNDVNLNGIQDAGEAGLTDVFIEFLDANEFIPTDSTGQASINAPLPLLNRGVRVARGVVIPAALPTPFAPPASQLNINQDCLVPLDNISNNPDIFFELFYKPWFSFFGRPEELYRNMLKNAQVWGSAHASSIYFDISTIFWNNNMLLPRLQDQMDPGLGRVFRLVDELGGPVIGVFDAVIHQSADPNDPTALVGPDFSFSTTGTIDISTFMFNPATAALVVDINLRSVIPDADLVAGRDIWVRRVFQP